jgi:hypothetical protein
MTLLRVRTDTTGRKGSLCRRMSELLWDTHGLQKFRLEKIPSAVRGGAQIEAVCDVLGADFCTMA